jgi:hypothetical protein
MRITKDRLREIIIEEIVKAQNRGEAPIEEGWKEAALAAAMGLSSLGAPAPAQAAPTTPAPYSQTMDVESASPKRLDDLAQNMEKYVGPRSTHWLADSNWSKRDVYDDTLTAWQEIYSGVEDFWINTLPNQRAGCEQNAEMQICKILKQVERQYNKENTRLKQEVEAQQDKDPYKVNRRLIKKMYNFLIRWAPDTKNETDFQRTDGWTENAKGFDPSGPGTIPDDDEL